MRPSLIAAEQDGRLAAAAYFRHLPVVDDAGLIGMVDISDVCRALLDLSVG
jgi:CBS domain-containing protein